MDTVINRILSLVDKSELNEKQILQKLDISNSSTITDWRTGKSKSPSIKNVIKFADFFGVSTDYLLTGKINSDSITDEEREWLHLYNQLSDHNKIECSGFIKGYIAAQNNFSKNENNNNTNKKS